MTTRTESMVVHCGHDGLDVSLAQVARYAGGARYRMDVSHRESARALLKKAAQLVDPIFVYSVHEVKGEVEGGYATLDDRVTFPVFAGAQEEGMKCLAFCVCSIGPRLEAEVRHLMSADAALDGIFLDAAGVAFLDALSRRAHAALQQDAQKRELHCGCRLGPGCGDLDLSLQRLLFALVDASSIGVRLNEDCVMSPAKSLSFFTPWTTSPLSAADLDKCAACTLSRCDYRQGPPGRRRRA
jgi:hypothetical protein